MTSDYYTTLGLSTSASDTEIRAAYRKLALKYHPDKNSSPDAEQNFRIVSQAYSTLIDPKKREEYNQRFSQKQHPQQNGRFYSNANGVFTFMFGNRPYYPTTPFDFFSPNLFNIYNIPPTGSSFNFRTAFAQQPEPKASDSPLPQKTYNTRKRTKPSDSSASGESQGPGASKHHKTTAKTQPESTGPPKPMEFELPITLEEVLHGCTKERTVTCNVLDPQTKKRMKVEKSFNIEIEPGWKAGTKITYPEEGSVENESSKASDIVFVVRDKPHPVFQRDKADLLYNAKVTLKESLCGTKIMVPTLTNFKTLTFKSVVSPQTVHRIPGEGLPIPGQPNKKGDLVVSFDIVFPDKISKSLVDVLCKILP